MSFLVAYFKLSNIIFSYLSPVITFLGEWWGQTNLYLYGKQEDICMISQEKSLTVINHYGDVDWLTCWVFAERLGFLGVRLYLFMYNFFHFLFWNFEWSLKNYDLELNGPKLNLSYEAFVYDNYCSFHKAPFEVFSSKARQ